MFTRFFRTFSTSTSSRPAPKSRRRPRPRSRPTAARQSTLPVSPCRRPFSKILYVRGLCHEFGSKIQWNVSVRVVSLECMSVYITVLMHSRSSFPLRPNPNFTNVMCEKFCSGHLGTCVSEGGSKSTRVRKVVTGCCLSVALATGDSHALVRMV